MLTYIQLPVLNSAVIFAAVNRHLHSFDICSLNGSRTQLCNVIHAISMKIRPPKPTALKYVFDFISVNMNKHAALSASDWFVHWAGKPLSYSFTSSEIPKGSFTSHKRPSTCETNMAASEVSRDLTRLLKERRYFCDPH